ncbi:MAG: alkaline phosphatase [candidate division KSB1 bacterium]|nr:alkaline phosphatase [candidate division KSB1 bacterium]
MKHSKMRLLLLAIILYLTSFSFASTPKNIILMISDGCGFNHIAAASLFEHGRTGVQIYEQFPVRYAMSTYPATGIGYDPTLAWSDFEYVRQKPTDSGAAATAMATGAKTYNGAIGVDVNKVRLKNIVEMAEALGKATGVITSVPFSHATPAGFVAHNVNRRNYEEIAREMILDSRVDVIMGDGPPFLNATRTTIFSENLKRVAGRDVWKALTQGQAGGDADGDGIADPWFLIQDREAFQRLASGPTPKRVIGIAKVATTLQQERNGDRQAPPYAVPFIQTVPTLEEMTKAALNILDDDPDGFFLMIEGGAVDWAAHNNQSGRMIEEEIGFNWAVVAVVSWVEQHSNWDETLVIVTADHETGYLTGPNSGVQADGRPVWHPIENRGQGVVPGMQWNSGEHTNSLVAFFAKGAGSELFDRYADQIDPVRGRYLDNTELGAVLLLLFGPAVAD